MDNQESLSIATEIVWRVMDDNAVVVTPQTGKVRVLNPVGSAIWQRLVENKSVPEIATHLATHFEVSHTQAQQDIQQFIEELKARGIVTIH